MSAKVKYSWKKIGKAALWLALGGVLVVLSISAISNKRSEKVAGIHIDILGSGENAFTTTAVITKMMNEVQGTEIVHQAIGRLRLNAMEEALEKMEWVRQAEIYMDNNGILQVSIHEEMPVARIFTGNGRSWYLSSTLQKLPIPKDYLNRLPVFTGYPAGLNKSKDSSLLADVYSIALFIQTHPFWMAQIEQISVNTEREFIIIPKLGNQIILFGTAHNYEKKFHNLLAFYQKVQMQTGWDKYEKIDLRFDNQIVATRRDATELRDIEMKSENLMNDLLHGAGPLRGKKFVPNADEKDFPMTKPKDQKDPRKTTPEIAPEKLREPTPKMQPPVNSANPQFLKVSEKSKSRAIERKPPAEDKVEVKIKNQQKRKPKAVMPPSKKDNEKIINNK